MYFVACNEYYGPRMLRRTLSICSATAANGFGSLECSVHKVAG